MNKTINPNGKNASEMFENTIRRELEAESDKKLDSVICHTLRDMFGYSACEQCPVPCSFSTNCSNNFMNKYTFLVMAMEEWNKRQEKKKNESQNNR